MSATPIDFLLLTSLLAMLQHFPASSSGSEDRNVSSKKTNNKRKASAKKLLPSIPGKKSQRVSTYGLSWMGLRVKNVADMSEFFQSCLGLHEIHRCSQDHAVLQTDNGDYVALFGPSTARFDLFRTGPVIGFRVHNIREARALMEEQKVRFIGPVHVRDKGKWKYAHFLGPDKVIYELVEESVWTDEDE